MRYQGMACSAWPPLSINKYLVSTRKLLETSWCKAKVLFNNKSTPCVFRSQASMKGFVSSVICCVFTIDYTHWFETLYLGATPPFFLLQSAFLSLCLPMAFQVISIKILKTAVGFPVAISKEESISQKFRNVHLVWPLLSEGFSAHTPPPPG